MAECRKVINNKVRNFKHVSSYGQAGSNHGGKPHSRFASDDTEARWQRYLIKGCPGVKNRSRPQTWIRPAMPVRLFGSDCFLASLSFPGTLERAQQDRVTLGTSFHLPKLSFHIRRTVFSSLPLIALCCAARDVAGVHGEQGSTLSRVLLLDTVNGLWGRGHCGCWLSALGGGGVTL